MENKTWKYPVGTQREWSNGAGGTQRVIKTHDNNVFENTHPAWMNLPTIPKDFLDTFKACDKLGKRIFDYKEPIEGEIWLDKEFDDFTTSTGKNFTGAEFKKFSPFVKGTYGFDFYQTLCLRYLKDKIDLNAKIAEELLDANEEKIRNERSTGAKVDKTIVLTKEEIEEIKEKARREFKFDDSQKLVLSDATDIKDKLDEILGYLEKGEDLDGNEKEVYERAKKLLLELQTGAYRSITEIKSDVRATLKEISLTFQKNFGIRESFKKKMALALNEYIARHRKKIEEEELENFKKQIGVDLYTDTDTFYKALRALNLFEDFNVENPKFIGELIQHPDSKFDDVILQEVERDVYDDGTEGDKATIKILDPLTDREYRARIDVERLQELIRNRQVGASNLDVPLKLRFRALFNKDLDGEWSKDELVPLEVFEKISQYLPDGHVMTNNSLVKLEKSSYGMGSESNGYAFYNPGDRKINLSGKALRNNQLASTDIHSGVEIASVLIHEIGHSLSQKLGRRKSKMYREFVRDCGWSWEQFQWEDAKKGIYRENNFVATGDDNDIPRHGSKSGVPLITPYAGKSPEEAFAEYYSFYSQYKKEIDSFIKSGNENVFHKDHKPQVVESKKTYGEFLKEAKLKYFSGEEKQELFNRRRTMDSLLADNKRGGTHIKTDMVDPYYDSNLETMEERKVNQSLIITEKDRKSTAYSDNAKNPNPVFTVFNHITGKHDILDTQESKDPQVHYANKYLRRYSPTYSISKECFNILAEKGYTLSQIRDYTLSKVRDQKIPEVRTKLAEVQSDYGMNYAGQFVPSSKLVKMKTIFTTMKKVWESDELKKALRELFTNEDNTMWEEILRESNPQEIKKADISTLFSGFVDKLKNIFETARVKTSKKEFGDSVIFNKKGQILLVQRRVGDKIFPGLWGLPGGHLEAGEHSNDGALRELTEETNILPEQLSTYQFLEKLEKEDYIIYYHEGRLADESAVIILNNDEHDHYEWVDLCNLSDYQLIGDLKDKLLTLPYTISPTIKVDSTPLNPFEPTDIMKDLEDAFDKGQITEQEYFEGLKLQKGKDYDALLQKMYKRKGLDENVKMPEFETCPQCDHDQMVKGCCYECGYSQDIEKSFNLGEIGEKEYFEYLSKNN